MALRLQEEVLRQQGTDIRELRETLAEFRRDMERGMQPAPKPEPEPAPAPEPPDPNPENDRPCDLHLSTPAHC
jgi:hypothetical protein